MTENLTATAMNDHRDDGTPFVYWEITDADGNVLERECGHDEPGHLSPGGLRALEARLIVEYGDDAP